MPILAMQAWAANPAQGEAPVVFPATAHARIEPVSDKMIVESQDGVNARVRLVRPNWQWAGIINFTLHNADLSRHEFNWMDDTPDFLSIDDDWLVFATRDITTEDYGTHGPCRVSFYDVDGNTMAVLMVTFVVADTAAGAIPAARPWDRQTEVMEINFQPGTWLGPMTNPFGDVYNTGNGTMRIDGRASCMTPPHPDYINDDSGGYGNGLYEYRIRFDKNHIGNNTGPLAILWPFSNVWPGPEVDIGEFMADGSNAPGPGGVHYFANHYKIEDGTPEGVDGNHIYAIQDVPAAAPNRQWDPTLWHTYSALLTNTEVTFRVDGILVGIDSEKPARDFRNGGENHTIGLMCNSDDQGLECDWVKWTPEQLLSTQPPVVNNPLPPPPADGLDTLDVYVSGVPYEGDPVATVAVNDVQRGGAITVTARTAQDDVQVATVRGAFGANPKVSYSFTNDLYGGSPTADRELRLEGFVYNGVQRRDLRRWLSYNRTFDFTLNGTIPPARRVEDFVKMLGVCVHDYDGTPYGHGGVVYSTKIINAIQHLGFRNIRWSYPNDSRLNTATNAFAQAGLRFCIVHDNPTITTASLETDLDNLTPYASSVMALEGPNEINLFPTTWNGENTISGWRAFQQAFHGEIRSRPAFDNSLVLPFSLASLGTEGLAEWGDLTRWSDLGNNHCYFPDNRAPNDVVQYCLGLMAVNNPGQSGMFTETGYNTNVSTGATTESVQAKQSLNHALNCFQYGIRGVFFYELFDLSTDPGYADGHWGLFGYEDGNVAPPPKPAATAFHNLTTIIADGGATRATFSPGKLWYSLSGTAASTSSVLLQKSNGDFVLIVWSEPEIWDNVAKVEKTFTQKTVVASFYGAKSGVKVFDPLVGASAAATHSNVSSVSFGVRDHPVVLVVTP